MYRAKYLSVFVVLALCVGCEPAADCDCDPDAEKTAATQASLPSQRQLTSAEIVEVPETGIQLGWGYNAFDATSLANQCVMFTPAEEPAQTRTMTMKEVTDTYELQQRMNVSAEASVKAMGVEGKGKASFAKNVNLSGSRIHFLLDASVDNGVRYAAPYTQMGDSAARSVQRRGPSIRLTDSAATLARDPAEFLRQCGTGFVSAVYSGASINAVISIAASSRSEKQDIRAEVEAKGWGATAKGSTHMGSSTSASSNEKSITVLMVGGRGDSIPKDQAELEAKLQTLSYSAYEAPKDFRMAVTPYESLPNWPQDRALQGESDEMEQLAGVYGDYTTLYDEIEYFLLNPELYAAVLRTEEEDPDNAGQTISKLESVPLISATAGAEELRYLGSLQDYVQHSLRKLETLAAGCLNAESDMDDKTACRFDEADFVDSYALRSQLPLRYPITDQSNTQPSPDCSDFSGIALSVCQQQAKVLELSKLLDVQDDLDVLVAERWILSKSRSRCRLDIVDIGCLSNAKAQHWQSMVGERLLMSTQGQSLVKPEFASTLKKDAGASDET